MVLLLLKATIKLYQTSTSFFSGLRIWRIFTPTSDGLNGACTPYGYGRPISSGIYALTLYDAVVFVANGGIVYSISFSYLLFSRFSSYYF